MDIQTFVKQTIDKIRSASKDDTQNSVLTVNFELPLDDEGKVTIFGEGTPTTPVIKFDIQIALKK